MTYENLSLRKIAGGGFIIESTQTEFGYGTPRQPGAANTILHACTTIEEALFYIGENITGGHPKPVEESKPASAPIYQPAPAPVKK